MRRRLAIVLLCLLAGAAINVLVAWGIGAVVKPGPNTFGTAQTGTHWPIHPPADWPRPEFVLTSRAIGFRNQHMSANLERHPIGPCYAMSARLYGWPTQSMRTRDVGVTLNSTFRRKWPGAYYEGLLPPRLVNKGPLAYHRLALEPLWPGFAVNTVMFGGVLWVAVLGAFAARKARRRRGGRCVNCGYSLEDLPTCPECGTVVATVDTQR